MGHGRYIPSEPVLEWAVLVGGPLKEIVFSGMSRRYVVRSGGDLHLTLLALPGNDAGFDISVDLVGEGAVARLDGLYLCGSDESVSIRTAVHHRVGGALSSQLFKGIAGGASKAVFDGTIIVAPDAEKTEAYQENHNILLSESARVETRPQLEIYADDVKCSHGATVGRLDPEAQFYMRTRGIPEGEARILQMLSFLSPVLETLPENFGEGHSRGEIISSIESALRSM